MFNLGELYWSWFSIEVFYKERQDLKGFKNGKYCSYSLKLHVTIIEPRLLKIFLPFHESVFRQESGKEVVRSKAFSILEDTNKMNVTDVNREKESTESVNSAYSYKYVYSLIFISHSSIRSNLSALCQCNEVFKFKK